MSYIPSYYAYHHHLLKRDNCSSHWHKGFYFTPVFPFGAQPLFLFLFASLAYHHHNHPLEFFRRMSCKIRRVVFFILLLPSPYNHSSIYSSILWTKVEKPYIALCYLHKVQGTPTSQRHAHLFGIWELRKSR